MDPWFEDLPLDFAREETRAAERLLIAGYPMSIAMLTLAQDAGLDTARVNQMAPPNFLMRDILGKARLSNRLVALPNVIAQPHIGSATIEGREASGEKVIANIRFWADGHRPPDQVLDGLV